MKYVVEIAGEQTVVEIEGGEVVVDGERVVARLSDVPDSPVSILTIGERTHRVIARRGSRRGSYSITVDGRRHAVDALDERTRAIRDLTAHAGPAGPTPLVAPMPGLVVRVHVAPGDRVEAGQGLVVMEAMKMENELRATGSAVVKAVLAVPGTPVEKGAVLVELE